MWMAFWTDFNLASKWIAGCNNMSFDKIFKLNSNAFLCLRKALWISSLFEMCCINKAALPCLCQPSYLKPLIVGLLSPYIFSGKSSLILLHYAGPSSGDIWYLPSRAKLPFPACFFNIFLNMLTLKANCVFSLNWNFCSI